MKVAVIGGGLVGSSWAVIFARSGNPVTMFDKSDKCLALAPRRIENILNQLSDYELIENKEEILSRISFESDIETALLNCEYVQECVPEVKEIKESVFNELAKYVSKNTILASSTSSLSPSSFTSEIPNRARCLVVHPINPPHLHDMVELVPAPWTDEKSIDKTKAFMKSLGMSTVQLKGEIEGFVVNRLQSAILHEAFRLVESGLASAEDVDIALVKGLAPRWSFMGPFETIDLNAPNGIADYVSRYGDMYAKLGESQLNLVDWQEVVNDGLTEVMRQKTPFDRLPEKQEWRNSVLMSKVAGK